MPTGATADMSHFAFVNPGGPQVPDLANAKRYGITRLYWQANDVQLDAKLFQAITDNPDWRGMEEGILRDPIWGTLTNAEYDAAKKAGKSVPGLSAIDLARTLDADLARLGRSKAQCAVLADIEYHDPAYIIAFLHEWRALRPNRMTGWTLEPNQGGWVTPTLVSWLRHFQVTIFPQAYLGNQTPTDPDWTRCDLIERGLPRGSVSVCYSALHLPQYWDGIAFRFDQLP